MLATRVASGNQYIKIDSHLKPPQITIVVSSETSKLEKKCCGVIFVNPCPIIIQFLIAQQQQAIQTATAVQVDFTIFSANRQS
jgi:hypothetical protein